MGITNSNKWGRLRWRQTEHTPFRRTAIALAVASVAVMAQQPAYAAPSDKTSLKELKAEIARLKKALEQKDEELAAQKSAAPAPAAETPTAETPSSEQPAEQSAESEPEAKPEEPKALSDVVVRGARRTLRQKHNEPNSVSVVTGQELEQTGAYTLADFARRSANLSRDTGNPRTLSLAIRGIGRKGITEAQDPSVLTAIDGISFAYNSLATWDQVDVEAVEVNRGPGGTLGGKNYSLGNINITTRGPSFTPGGRYAMRFGIQDTFYGDFSYGGPVIDNLLAWRGTFFIHKQAGVYQNDYDLRGRTYIDTNKISGRVQFLYTPSDDFTARLRVDVQPRTAENFNGLNFFHKEPATFTNGNPWNHATTAFNRLNRGWFKQLRNYSLYGNYYNFNTGLQNNDSQQALETGMNGVTGEMNWKVAGHTLTSITGWKDFWFDARNDEGTPFDVSLQGGGGVRYEQFSQELKIASEKGGFADYVTGLYYIKTRTDVDAKAGWGSDAGYWFANGTPNLYPDPITGTTTVATPITGPAYTRTQLDPITGRPGLVYGGVYGRLTADAAGRYLLGDSLNGLRTLGQMKIRNQSPAWYGTVNWHLTDALTLTTGIRTTYEDRTTTGYKVITDNGFADLLNPSKSSFGVKLGGFDSVFVSAPGVGGYNGLGADGKWRTYNYDKEFNAPVTASDLSKGGKDASRPVDANTYVLNNRIVDQDTWWARTKGVFNVKDGTYATNDAFYSNGAKLGLGTDVSDAFTHKKIGTSNATKAETPTSDIVRVGVGTAALTTDSDNYKAALKKANAAAFKYFGKTTTTDAKTGVVTQAWDQLSAAQQRMIADAQNLRKAQIGPVYNTVTAQPFRKLQITSVVSPSYKFNEDLTGYTSWQHGEQAGISQIVNGISRLAAPQTTDSYEIGLKSFWFDKTLTLNTDAFFMNIDDYQQAVQVLDEYTTALNNDGTLYWTSATLNAKRVQAWGVEMDGTYTGLPNTALRFSAAYNDAWYQSFKNSPLSPELDPNDPLYKKSPFQDLSGRTLPGASKFSFNIGGEYRQPVFDGFEGHTAVNYSYQTGYNADVTLSKYGWVDGYGLTDLTVGLGRKDKTIDVSFLVRNLFDARPMAELASSSSLQTAPRWYGVVVSGQF